MANPVPQEKPTSRRGRAQQARTRRTSPSASPPARHLENFIEWYQELSLHNLKNIRRHYTRNLFFKDPFTELYTVEDLEKYYARTFERVSELRFVLQNKMEDANQAFLTWTITFKMLGRDCAVHGVTHLKFDASGLCEFHRDYFDLAEEIYEHIPVLGYAFKGLKRVLQ